MYHHRKHGKFRPKLLQLVSSNSEAEIKSTTQSAFAPLLSETAIQGNTSAALNTLIQLKGIGPASASLLLAVFRPDEVPFFSDEAYRWIMHTGSSSAGGWDSPIKYNLKEYLEYLRGVSQLIERLDGKVKAVDVERVGWVLGREKAVIARIPEDDAAIRDGAAEPSIVSKSIPGMSATTANQQLGDEKVKAGMKRSRKPRGDPVNPRTEDGADSARRSKRLRK